MNKPELMEEVRYHRQKEEEEGRGIRSVRGIRRAIRSVRDDFETRLIQIERRLAEQEQYTRLECVDFPENPRKVKNLKQLYSTFSKWPEYQWKNAIPCNTQIT